MVFVYGLLPRDNNWSINRVYINEINNYLCYKSKLNALNFINHTDWTLQDASVKQNLFYADKLHFFEEENTKLVVSIYNSINSNASIDKSVSIFSKLFDCHTGFNLKQEDFLMLSCNMSIRNSVCNPDKPIVNYVRKPFLKSFCTSSVLPALPLRIVMFVQENSLELVPFLQVKLFMIVMFAVQVNPLVIVMFVQLTLLVLVLFVLLNQIVVVMFV